MSLPRPSRKRNRSILRSGLLLVTSERAMENSFQKKLNQEAARKADDGGAATPSRCARKADDGVLATPKRC